MPLILKPMSVIETELGIQPNGPVQKFFTESCYKHMDEFVPFDKGDLATTVIVGTSTIVYASPYARYQYYGVRNDGSHKINEANRNREFHPLATSYWDQKMWTAKKDDVIEEVYKKMGGK